MDVTALGELVTEILEQLGKGPETQKQKVFVVLMLCDIRAES